MPKFYIKTFGCQMNENDSEKMGELLHPEGYQKTADPDEADLIIINTCSIRDKAYQKAISEIGRRRKIDVFRRPVVAITGCVVSHDGDTLMKRFPFVDIVLGPDHLASLPRLVRESREKNVRSSLIDFQDISDYEFPHPLLVNDPSEKKVKAYVTIMKGCDNVCSFCIVPFVRGREVSRPAGEILEEIRRLESQEIREIMLLGQNVNSYGKGLSKSLNFAGLLRRIDKETTFPRLRFTSPHPKDLSDELIEEYGCNQKLCPHLHLPVQSGSNRVLRRMRRSYTRETYLRRVDKIRRRLPEIAITTDLIVGFPGETTHDFAETVSLVREVAFDASYSFVFSPRPQTEAAGFVDDVPPVVKRERLAALRSLQSSISFSKNRSRIGKRESVLVEGFSSRDGEGCRQMTGRTPHGRIVNFDGDLHTVGAILDLQITEASPNSLKGVLC